MTYGGIVLARASAATSPITRSITITSGMSGLALFLSVNGGTNRAGGAPSLSGSTFTQANTTQKAAASPECSVELWLLANPAIGTLTLTIPNTGLLTVFSEVVAANAPGGGRVSLGPTNGGNNTATNPTPGATDHDPADLVFSVTAGGWQTWLPSAQAGTAITNTDDGATGYGSQYSIRAATGPYTGSWTFGTSDDWGAVQGSFKEIPPIRLNNYLRPKTGTGISIGGIG
jgi:hypothetical protein